MENKICRVCLVTNVKMYDVQTPAVLSAYLELTGISDISSYTHICYECVARLLKCEEFRTRCFKAHEILTSLVSKRDIETERIQKCLVSRLKQSNTIICDSNNTQQSQIGLELNYPEVKIEKSNATDSKNFALLNNTNSAIGVNDYDSDAFSDDNTLEGKVVCYSNNPKQPQIELVLDYPEIKIEKTSTTDSINCELLINPTTGVKAFDSDVLSHNTLKVKESEKTKLNLRNKTLNKKVLKQKVAQTKDSKVCKNPLKKLPTRRKGKTAETLNQSFEFCFKPCEKFFSVINMSMEEAKREVELRKESKNYLNSKFKCALCYRSFCTDKTFNNHMRNHNLVSGKLECEVCHQRYPSRKSYQKHKNRSHTHKFLCKMCSYICFDLTQAKGHMRLHKGKKYTCEICSQEFSFHNTLLGHKRLKHSTETMCHHVCALCGDAFTTNTGLSVHNRMNHKQETNAKQGPQCVECDVHFATETAWKRHLVLSAKHQTIETCDNKCDICGKTFPDLNRFKIHLRLEACEDAATIVKRSKNCNRSEKSSVCEICGEKFKNPSYLKYHRIKHTGKSPHTCDICGKLFLFSTYLKTHKESVHSNSVYKCDLCSKEFKAKAIIINHMRRTHPVSRTQKCDICGKAFQYPSQVKVHKQHVHDNVPWPKRDRSVRNKTNDELHY